MAAKSSGLTFEDFHEWSSKGDNYKSETDCKSAWNSFKKTGGITENTLFYLARKKGWLDSNKSLSSTIPTTVFNRIRDIWDRCLPATIEHGYITRKQGIPNGLRYYPFNESELVISNINIAGYLVVPYWSDDEIQTLQFIPPGMGKKLNLPGASFNDGYFTVGLITDLIYICEGIGHAWAVYKTNNASSAIVCFSSNRMMQVSKIIRNKYPNTRIIIISDREKEKLASDIAVSIAAQWIELPDDKPKNYDVNDYAQDYGYEALANLLVDTKFPVLHYRMLSIDDIYNSSPMDWIVKGIIPKVGLSALYGPSGSGKSFLLLDLALKIVTGETFWFSRRINAVPITYICLEGEFGLIPKRDFGNRLLV